MLRSCVLGAALGLLGLAYAPADAADAQNQKKVRGQELLARIVPPLLAPEALEKLKLTSQQKEKFEKVNNEFKDKAKDAAGKIREAFQNKDKDKIREAFQSLRTDMEKLRNDSLAKVEAFLTDEQKKVFQEVKKAPQQPGAGRPGAKRPGAPEGRPGAGISGIPPFALEKLKLTEEQKKKLAEIQKDTDARIAGVLTEEQKKQLEELKKQGTPRRRPKSQ